MIAEDMKRTTTCLLSWHICWFIYQAGLLILYYTERTIFCWSIYKFR